MRNVLFWGVMVALFGVWSPSIAQDTTVPSLEEKIKELELRKKIAELEKSIAEAEKSTAQAAIDTAKVGAGTTKGQEGTITGTFGYAADLIAYSALADTTNQIGKELAKLTPKPTKILLVNSADVAAGEVLLLQINKQIDYFANALSAQQKANSDIISAFSTVPEWAPMESEDLREFAFPGGATAAITGATTVVSALADLVKLFKVDYEINARTFSVSSDAMNALIAKNNPEIPIYVLDAGAIADSRVVQSYFNAAKLTIGVRSSKDTLEGLVIPTLVTRTNGEKDKDKLKRDSALLALARSAVDTSKNLVTAFESFGSSITSAAQDKMPTLVSVATREYTKAQGFSHRLKLTIVSSGSEVIRAKKTFSSGNAAMVGGVAVAYQLLDDAGHIVSSGSHYVLRQLPYKVRIQGRQLPESKVLVQSFPADE